LLDEMDESDLRILDILQQDASLPTAEIANRVGLSVSPCWRRIRRLEKEGIILRRVALLDPHRLGLEITVFASVKLSAHGRQALHEFESSIEDLPEVVACFVMTGEIDYLLHVVTRDIRAYEHFLRRHLLGLPTVREIHSQIALSQLKHTTRLPLFLDDDESA
jgi:Lrp/AsnC family transcriptional regulator